MSSFRNALTANAETVKHLAWAVFAVVATVGLTIAVWNLRIFIHSGESTLGNVDRATGSIADYVTAEKARLQDPKNAKALDAAIQMGAVFNASGRLLNTQVIPRAMGDLDQGKKLLAALTTNSETTNAFILAMQNHTTPLIDAATADLVEGRNAIAGLTRLETQFGLTAEEATKAINDTAAGTGRTADQINAMLASADPRVQAMLDKGNAILQDVKDTTASMPTIGKNVEKTTHNIAAFSKVTIITGILSSLANATIPGLLH
jgi:hypothetical protein